MLQQNMLNLQRNWTKAMSKKYLKNGKKITLIMQLNYFRKIY